MLQTMNVTIFFMVKQLFNSSQTGVEVKHFTKTGAGFGAGVKFFGVGVESESKNSDSDHFCRIAETILSIDDLDIDDETILFPLYSK